MKLSVIVPIYNIENEIDRSVSSIVKQTYENMEIILVNDGSTDKSSALCDKWAKRDKRIKVIHKQNGGVSSARNLGLMKATGAFVTFVDGGDVIVENCYEIALKKLMQYDVDIIIFGIITKIYQAQELLRIESDNRQEETFSRNTLLNRYYEINLGNSVCNKIYKIEVLKDCFFDERMDVSEDLWFNLNVYQNIKNISLISDNLYLYIRENKIGRQYTRMNFEVAYKNNIKLSHKLIQLGVKEDVVNSHLYTDIIKTAYNQLNSDVFSNVERYKIKELLCNDMLGMAIQNRNKDFDDLNVLFVVLLKKLDNVTLTIFLFKIKEKLKKRFKSR